MGNTKEPRTFIFFTEVKKGAEPSAEIHNLTLPLADQEGPL